MAGAGNGMILEPPEFEAAPAFRLRGRQPEWLETIDADLKTYSRLLVVAPGGVGKTSLFAALAARMHSRNIRTLVLANRDRLTRQTADRIRKETGLEVDVEMGVMNASPFAHIVVASVQTLSRINRLTGFDPLHFGIVVADEAHFSISDSWLRILRYFHYGNESLAPDYKPPEDGTYAPKARVIGFTATPDIGEKRSLMDFYQHRSVDYSYLEAMNDGWLVRPVQKSIPVRIDIRKYKATHTPTGNDFKTSDLDEAIVPIIEELAEQHAIHAATKKAIAFLPSVRCASLMAAALCRRGIRGIFVSGDSLDTDENTELFVASGPGTTLCNAVLYNFGVDFPDVDCIGWYRATLSRAFYIQGIYRGTRVLPGTVDGLESAEERLAAIEASAKNHLLILDPLFIHERIDLMDVYSLYTDKPEVAAKMKELGAPTPENAEKGERDFAKALLKEARKHARKAERTIDPLKWGLMIQDGAIANYQPETIADARAPTPGQIAFLERNGIEHHNIKHQGLASKIIGRFLTRFDRGLATYYQLTMLKRLGLPEEEVATLTQKEASSVIGKILEEKKRAG